MKRILGIALVLALAFGSVAFAFDTKDFSDKSVMLRGGGGNGGGGGHGGGGGSGGGGNPGGGGGGPRDGTGPRHDGTGGNPNHPEHPDHHVKPEVKK